MVLRRETAPPRYVLQKGRHDADEYQDPELARKGGKMTTPKNRVLESSNAPRASRLLKTALARLRTWEVARTHTRTLFYFTLE